MNDPRYEVKNELIKNKLIQIGGRLIQAIEDIPGYGFAFLLFSYGEKGDLFYLSTAQREDMIKLLDEFKAKLQEQPKNEETGYKL
jgi:hypothetical protein